MILLVKLDHGVKAKAAHGPDSLGLLKLSSFYKYQGIETKIVSCKDKIRLSEDPSEICFSPVFGFHLSKDIQYINGFAKRFPKSEILIGGVQATHKPEIFKKYIPGAKIFEGIQDFDDAPPDYEGAGKSFSYGFTSRGCVRKCQWCIVPKVEGKLEKISYWKNTLGDGHSHFSCMDNNALACGPEWVESILSEMEKRKMKVDFNQALDCRIFAKGEFSEIFKRYLKSFAKLRFAWDSSAVDKYVIKTLDIFEKKGLSVGDDNWLMLYGNGESPEEIWNRVKILTEANQKVKPMRFLDLETGKGVDGWPKAFARYISLITGPSGLIVPTQFSSGIYGRNEKEFLNCLKLGAELPKVRKLIGHDSVRAGTHAEEKVLKFIKKVG